MPMNRTWWLPLGILMVTLGVTWQVWNHERLGAQRQLQTHFEHALLETTSRIEQRMGAYEQMLRGVQAQYAAMGKIDRKGLQDYVALLQLDANFSGVQAIGQVDWVLAEQKAAHVGKMQRLGFSDYTIRPEGLRDAYAPVVQREPYIGRNQAAFGFDGWAEPMRQLAMERSRDSGMAAISGKVRLTTETEPVEQPSFIMYLPIYASGQPSNTLEQRRRHFKGWVFAAFRMNDLMASLYGQLPPGIGFSLHDGIEISGQSLLYQSEQQVAPVASILTAHEYLVVGGRTWALTVMASGEFAERFGRSDAPLIAISGVGLSLLLTLLSWLLTTSRARALRLAREMTVELQESVRFVQMVTDHIPGLVAYWNSALRCEFANAQHEEFFGKTKAEIQGITMRELIGAQAFRQQEDCINAVLRGEAQHFESTLTKPDGSTCFTYAYCLPDRQGDQVKGFYVLISDITPLKQAEAALRHFASIIQSSEDAIISKSLDGIVTSWNPGAQLLFGFAADEMIGRSMQCLFPEDRQVEEAEILGRIQRGEPTEHFETVRLHKDGRKVEISVTISPIFDSAGEIVGISTIARDITAQKLVETELAKHRNHLEALVQERTAALLIAKDAAEAANRAKTIFLATMSHELRTPMNAIMGLTGIVRRSSTDAKQISLLDKVLLASNQLLEIINDVLELSNIEANQLHLEQQTFTLGDSLERIVHRFKPEAQRKDLLLAVVLDPALAGRGLRGDPVRLEQILGKLISNAIKFTAAGSVTVCAAVSEEDATHVVLRFEIADTGIGIPAEEQGRLFSAFEQLDGSTTRKFGGTGLGLAISKKLVQAMNGSIGVDSQLGAGSTFWFSVAFATSLA